MPHYNRHFAGDAHSHLGFWGPPTSGANFCEEDYAVTWYIAEFTNSVSSLAYVYYALKPHYPLSPRQRGKAPRLSSRGGTQRGWDSMSISLLLVGITSTVFHALLHNRPQHGDDLSMLLLTGSNVQAAYSIGRPKGDRTATLVGLAVWIGTAVSSAAYLVTGSIQFHFIMFSITLVMSIPGVAMRVLSGTGPGFGGKATTRSAVEIKDEEALRAGLKRRLLNAGVCFVLGFALWNVDLELCFPLRQLRAAVGLPWAWLFEMHGWWHILTAVAAGEFTEVIRDLQDDAQPSDKGKQSEE